MSSLSNHTPNDLIYLMPISVSCPFCIQPGRRKIYSNLWKFRLHLRSDHNFDSLCRDLIVNLENLIDRGVLR